MVASLRTFAISEDHEHQKLENDLNNDSDNVTKIAIKNVQEEVIKSKKIVDTTLSQKIDEVKDDELLNRTFNFYNSHIKLSMEEKLNVVEREIVKIYRQKNKFIKH